MDFFKKNLVFSILILACLLASAAGGYLAFAESGKVSDAKKKISNAEEQLKNLQYADPAPTSENVASSEQNVEDLESQLGKIRENLEQGSRINASTDGVRVMSSIQQHISDFGRRAAANKDEDGEPSPIVISDDFAFGFDEYIDSTPIPDDVGVIPVLDKQRQILSYILNQLMELGPTEITAIQREVPSAEPSEQGFKINPAVSARVPGAIDTMAFSVTFTGYTDVLRGFLNRLAEFELPIVVRSVEVTRPTTDSATRSGASSGSGLDDLFGSFSGDSSTEAPTDVAQEPVFTENDSTFTVVLEFIEIILPSDSEENPS